MTALSKISRLWGLFTGLIVIGIITYFILLWYTSQSITAEIKSIENVKYSLINNRLETCFKLQVNNSGPIDVVIEKIYYKVYINNKYLGEGVKENIMIERGENNIDICLSSKSKDIINSILSTLKGRGKVNVTVKGYIEVPIKSFGVIKLWTLQLPYEETVEVEFKRI